MTAPARKTFSGLDTRKHAISPPHREPNEQLQRASRVETREECLATVLAQPHRNGLDDPARHWAIGRLILDGVVSCRGISSGKLIRAAELYDRAWSDMRWIMDSRRPWINSTARRPLEPTQEDKDAINKAWADIEDALKDAGPDVRKSILYVVACERVILDRPTEGQPIPWVYVSALPHALRALVKHFELDK